MQSSNIIAQQGKEPDTKYCPMYKDKMQTVQV